MARSDRFMESPDRLHHLFLEGDGNRPEPLLTLLTGGGTQEHSMHVPPMRATKPLKADVHVRKASIQLAEVEEDAVAVVFVFDASVPCKVKVSFIAVEEIGGGVEGGEGSAEGVEDGAGAVGDVGGLFRFGCVVEGTEREFDAGIGQTYTAEFAATDGALVSPARMRPIHHTARQFVRGHRGGCYAPILISICPVGGVEGEEITIGEFVDGGKSLRVVSQRLAHKGVALRLYEVFGTDDGSGGSGSGGGGGGEDCVICLSEKTNTVLLPCRHRCLCEACASQLREQGHSRGKCPVCRAPVSLYLTPSDSSTSDDPTPSMAAAPPFPPMDHDERRKLESDAFPSLTSSISSGASGSGDGGGGGVGTGAAAPELPDDHLKTDPEQ